MNYKNLSYEQENNVAVVTINRPDKLNALNNDTLNELSLLLDEIKSDDNISVIIITGSGKKAFVAGADIKEINELSKESALKFAEFGQSVFTKIEQLGKPVIAAINGYALGGGCELSLACHIRVCSENAKFGQPEVKLGIIPGYGGTQRLTKLINSGRALEYILTGDMISAEDALRIGLVSQVHPQAELIDKTKEMAKKIASYGQISISKALASVQYAVDNAIQEGLKFEAEQFAESCDTEDCKEGTSAFLQKRAPHFQNK